MLSIISRAIHEYQYVQPTHFYSILAAMNPDQAKAFMSTYTRSPDALREWMMMVTVRVVQGSLDEIDDGLQIGRTKIFDSLFARG